jgi:hypothetical protein
MGTPDSLSNSKHGTLKEGTGEKTMSVQAIPFLYITTLLYFHTDI